MSSNSSSEKSSKRSKQGKKIPISITWMSQSIHDNATQGSKSSSESTRNFRLWEKHDWSDLEEIEYRLMEKYE